MRIQSFQNSPFSPDWSAFLNWTVHFLFPLYGWSDNPILAPPLPLFWHCAGTFSNIWCARGPITRSAQRQSGRLSILRKARSTNSLFSKEENLSRKWQFERLFEIMEESIESLLWTNNTENSTEEVLEILSTTAASASLNSSVQDLSSSDLIILRHRE